MKRTMILATALLIGTVLVAGAEERMEMAEMKEYEEAIEEFVRENADEEAGSITIGEYRSLMAKLSVLRQESAYVSKTAGSSFFMPGSGHIMNDAVGQGILFGAGGVIISAGTLVGAYFLLPESVQFTELNYFTDPFAEIETAWKALSFTDLLPSLGVLAGGGLIDMIYRGIVAKNAAELARERIDSGAKEFEPEFGLILSGGMPMVGMRHKF